MAEFACRQAPARSVFLYTSDKPPAFGRRRSQQRSKLARLGVASYVCSTNAKKFPRPFFSQPTTPPHTASSSAQLPGPIHCGTT